MNLSHTNDLTPPPNTIPPGSPSRAITPKEDGCRTPTPAERLAGNEERNRDPINKFHRAMQEAQITNTRWFNLAILGNGPLIIEGGAAVNLIVLSTLNNLNTPLHLKIYVKLF